MKILAGKAVGAGTGPIIRFASDFREHLRGNLSITFLLIVAGAAVEGIGLVLLLPILSVVLGSVPEGSLLAPITGRLLSLLPSAPPFWQLLFLLSIFALALAVRAAIILARDVTLARLQVDFAAKLRLETVHLLTKTRWDVLSRLRHSRIIHALGADIQASGDAAGMLLTSTVAAIMLLAQCVLVMLLSPVLAAIVAILLLLGALALRPVLRRSRELGEALTTGNLELANTTTQFLGGLKLAISQNLTRRFVEVFESTLLDAASRRIEFARQRTLLQLWLTAAAALVAGAAVLLGVGVLDTDASTLLAFLFVLARMNGPVLQLQAALQSIFHIVPAYEKVRQLQAELLPAEEATSADNIELPRSWSNIQFQSVSFRHGHRRSSADDLGGIFDVSLTIDAGSFLGVIGGSGSGKTTFADLLVGLFPPMEGQILVGSTPLGQRVLQSWRQQVSYVSQDAFLFHTTVRENLLWAKPNATEEDLWRALRLTGAEELVRRMEHGLETVVGERGTLLSGGERQRLAIARALLREPQLLVLDEATNAIDMAGERLLLKDILSLPSRPTTIIIAHRQSSLQLCDRLIEFNGGRLRSSNASKN